MCLLNIPKNTYTFLQLLNVERKKQEHPSAFNFDLHLYLNMSGILIGQAIQESIKIEIII